MQAGINGCSNSRVPAVRRAAHHPQLTMPSTEACCGASTWSTVLPTCTGMARTGMIKQ